MKLKEVLQRVLLIGLVIAAIGVAVLAWFLPTPYAASYAVLLLPVIYSAAGVLLVLALLLTRHQSLFLKICAWGVAGLCVLIAIWMLRQQYQFSSWKQEVLEADQATLKKLGQHFVIGYRSFDEVKVLVRSGAIGGIYLTVRNIRDKSVSEIRQEIDQLQVLRKQAGLPLLIVAADQEGGVVSRLSPPLERRVSLGKYVAEFPLAGREQAAFDYGVLQGRELAELGVNLNLSPVIDLKPDKKIPSDRFTRIISRAISDNPETVSSIAVPYIEGLNINGVQATLKHFPGLGDVKVDTHLASAHLQTSIATMNALDWLPFKKISKDTNALIMVGHVQLDALDSEYPASLSKLVLQSVIREEWKYEGLLITDDLTMDAIYQRKDNHLQDTAALALNAGMDLLLISYDVRQFYPAMAGLIRQYQQGFLDKERLYKSRQRIKKRLAEF